MRAARSVESGAFRQAGWFSPYRSRDEFAGQLLAGRVATPERLRSYRRIRPISAWRHDNGELPDHG
tara:strand:+ start:372 stop:569 length:198 start_codon:yes stop_codon:yes gene_type:complete